MTVHRFDEAPRHREPEVVAAVGIVIVGVTTGGAVHPNLDPAVDATRGDSHRRVGSDPVEVVRGDVGDGPDEQAGIGVHRGEVLGDVDDDAGSRVAETLHGLPDDPVDAHVDLDEIERADLEAAHVEQVADQGVEAVCLLGDRRQQRGTNSSPAAVVRRKYAESTPKTTLLEKRTRKKAVNRPARLDRLSGVK